MSKEYIEALKCLEKVNNYLNNAYDYKEIKEEVQKDINSIKQALLKVQEQEKVLDDVKKVKSGKTIIHIGKDLVMMNKAKYYEYVELENEPVSKRILQAKCEEQEKVLKILKEHKIDIYRLLDVESVSQYNEWENDNLTEEEFELLKRWVCKNE